VSVATGTCARCGERCDDFDAHGSFRDRGDGYCERCGRTIAWHAGRSCFCEHATGLPAPLVAAGPEAKP